MDGRFIAEHGSDPGKAPLGVPDDVCVAKEAVKIEEAKDLAKLVPAGIVAWAKGVVLVVADCLGAGLFDGLNCGRCKVDWLVEPDDVRFVETDRTQQIAVDARDHGAPEQAISGERHDSGAGLIRGKIEDEDFLAETAKALQTISGGRSGARVAEAQNAALPRRFQEFSHWGCWRRRIVGTR